MKRFLAVLYVALLGAILSSTAFAQSPSFLRPVPVYWADGSLTTDLTDEVDTTRTSKITTRDWNWSAWVGKGEIATAALPIAKIVFQATTSNWAGDSIYFAVEPSHDGGTSYAITPGLLGGVVAQTAALGNCAVLIPAAQVAPAQWIGYLVIDRDALPSTPAPNNNLNLVPDFRLKVYGDVGGTTPTYTGLTCTIFPLFAP